MADALKAITGHGSDPLEEIKTQGGLSGDSKGEEKAVEAAATYMEHFDAPSQAISKVEIRRDPRTRGVNGFDVRSHVTESMLGPALLQMRRVFTDNQRGGIERNKRSGRVSARVLGRRAWQEGEDRLFQKKTQPGKKDYAVLIGIDLSGSTAASMNRQQRYSSYGRDGGMKVCQFEVIAAYAQAELCARLGIKFAVYGHSGHRGTMTIMPVKTFDEPWNSAAVTRMSNLTHHSANYDGHTIEYYRKQLDKVQATEKVLMYYSDGEMPASNYQEELAILQREVQIARKKGYVLMAVGARTDAPIKHGLDTVRIDQIGDIPKVVRHLGKRLESL